MPTLTLRAIEDAVRASWSDETCDVADLPDWTPENPARGQCFVSALVLQDLVGGELLEAHVLRSSGAHAGWHYWLRLPGGVDVDLTLEQFGADEHVQLPQVVARAVPGPPLRSPERYVLLRERVLARLGLDDEALEEPRAA